MCEFGHIIPICSKRSMEKRNNNHCSPIHDTVLILEFHSINLIHDTVLILVFNFPFPPLFLNLQPSIPLTFPFFPNFFYYIIFAFGYFETLIFNHLNLYGYGKQRSFCAIVTSIVINGSPCFLLSFPSSFVIIFPGLVLCF